MPFQVQVGQSSGSGRRREEGEPHVVSPERPPEYLPQASVCPVMNSSADTPLTTSKPKHSAMKLQTEVVKKAKQNLYSRCLIL